MVTALLRHELEGELTSGDFHLHARAILWLQTQVHGLTRFSYFVNPPTVSPQDQRLQRRASTDVRAPSTGSCLRLQVSFSEMAAAD